MAGYAIPGGGGLVLNKKLKIQNLILGGGLKVIIFFCVVGLQQGYTAISNLTITGEAPLKH